jgi:predicted Zn-ribbon and HTH transcriptional regulator
MADEKVNYTCKACGYKFMRPVKYRENCPYCNSNKIGPHVENAAEKLIKDSVKYE